MRAFLVGSSAFLFGLALLGTSCSDDPAGEQLCDPGSNVFCRCRGTRESGTKACNEAGDAFGTCETSFGECEEVEGPTGSSGTGTGTGGGPPDPPDPGELFASCDEKEGLVCNEGLDCSPMGYCSKACDNFEDCTAAGDCIAFGANQLCAPYCTEQTDCGAYSTIATCGFTNNAVPTFGVVVCAQWGDQLALPPDGYPEGSTCGGDTACNLGFEGTERVCDTDGCTDGCRIDTDCAGGGEAMCSSDGTTVGSCGGGGGENIDTCPGLTVNLSSTTPMLQLSGDTSMAMPPSEAEGVDMDPKLCASLTPTEEDVYHVLVANSGTLIINVDTNATYDPILYVRDGSCDSGSQLDCEDSNPAGSGEIIELLVFDNDELWVFVDGFNGSTGAYTIDFDLTAQ